MTPIIKNLTGKLENGTPYRIKPIIEKKTVIARLEVFKNNDWHYELEESSLMIHGYAQAVKESLFNLQERTGIQLIKQQKLKTA